MCFGTFILPIFIHYLDMVLYFGEEQKRKHKDIAHSKKGDQVNHRTK
jgi:hypothetical protein